MTTARVEDDVMKQRVIGGDTKVTVLITAATAKYIRVASEANDKTQSRFVSDVLEGYAEVKEFDLDLLREYILAWCAGVSCKGKRFHSVDTLIPEILSIFGIEGV